MEPVPASTIRRRLRPSDLRFANLGVPAMSALTTATRNLSLAVLLALALGACGGGGTKPTPSAPAPPPGGGGTTPPPGGGGTPPPPGGGGGGTTTPPAPLPPLPPAGAALSMPTVADEKA